MKTKSQFGVRLSVLVGLITVLGSAAPAMAQATLPDSDAQARAMVRQMTDFLANQKRFSLEARSTLDVVLVSGQKIQFDNVARLSMQRPNKLRAERVGELVDQVFYYDGKSLTLHNPQDKVFATVPAPGTLEEMLDFARTRLDVVAPGGDLLYKNAYDILMDGVEYGFVVGPSVVEGVRCNHLAFRAPHVDWQICIKEGKEPLPIKFVITTRDIANAPQFSVVVTKWDLNPGFNDRIFSFAPPKTARKIDFLPIGSTAQ